MPVQSGEVACPRCHEDRVSLIHKIEDPRGERYVCMVCSKEFKAHVSVHLERVAK